MLRIEIKGGMGMGKTTVRRLLEKFFTANGIEFTDTGADHHNENDALMLPTTETILRRMREVRDAIEPVYKHDGRDAIFDAASTAARDLSGRHTKP